jgi:hypothetical protein
MARLRPDAFRIAEQGHLKLAIHPRHAPLIALDF